MVKLKMFVYGTCQSGAVAKFLKQSAEFNEKFEITEEVLSYIMISEDVEFADSNKPLKEADVLLYQPVRDIYGKNSTNYILSLLKPTADSISMPFVYNTCTWPIVPALKRDYTDEWKKGVGEKLVLIGIEAIDDLIDEGLSGRQILEMYDYNKIDFKFGQRLSSACSVSEEKESRLDVKVWDFIRDNLLDKRLFLYCSHPTSFVFVHMANQVLYMLGCDPLTDNFPLDFIGISTCGMPMSYPTASREYFKFGFESGVPPDGTDQFYRNIIIGHLKAKGVR
jgi:hypothetical protein